MLNDMLYGPLAIDLTLEQVEDTGTEEREGGTGEEPRKQVRVYEELRSAFRHCACRYHSHRR
jgi:hypothetical protein